MTDDTTPNTAPVEGLPLVHLVRPPLAPSEPGTRPPLLALAHGVGSNERDLFGLAPQLDPRCVVVSVRAPLTRAPDAYAWFNVEFTPQGPVIAPEQLDASRVTYAEFVGAAISAYGADPARVYTLGFSQGAIISLVTALTHPKLFAGVIALAGRIPPEAVPWLAAPDETAGLPVFMAHGTRDTIIRVEEARTARDVLQRQRVDLTYTEYPIEHRITPQMFAEMTAWLGQRLDGAAGQ
ncbi:MAG TPA: alpha/beta hydrolase-fold protein [Ktedonobacterales bacterium]|nr:alpha/beta hydrolase-fold protein [Ktedonobacterales bacterium]